MDYEELAKQYALAVGKYPGDPTFGTSFYDQYRGARSGMGYLRSLTDEDKAGLQPGQYEGLMANAKGAQGSAIAGGIISGLSGASQILTTSLQATKINDTSSLQNQINDIGKVGLYNYNNFDEIANDYSLAKNNVDINESDIRGMSGGQKAAAVGSSVLSGAATGLQIGGPWGALAGAVVGGVSSGLGIMAGDQKAKTQTAFLNAQADLATDMANQNLSAANERLLNRNNRKGAVNSVAKGGQIERRNKILKAYAAKGLSGPKYKEHNTTGSIVSKKANGGTCVRLRVR